MLKLGQKYRVLKIKKFDIIRAIESGTKKSALARENDLPLTTVCGIWNFRENLIGSAAATAKRCRLRGSAFSDVEEALVKWLKAARSKNLPISGPLLVGKALVVASPLNLDNFVCSNGWLARFKARHGITTWTVSVEVLVGGIHLPKYPWRQVEATTVQNCFKRAGFSVCAGDAHDASNTIDHTSDIVDEACKTLLAEVLERQGVTEGISFPDFRDADSDVQTSADMSDEAIVASVVEVSPHDSDEDDMESDNTGDPGPTVAEAAHCGSIMRVFAEKRRLAEKLAHSISLRPLSLLLK
ncbi:hypothetical protein HPB51_016250 [Rhipicephalus microplus]|uniref:HTH CENPB-type domain-containing protein n=1 Tax=Rhipicephalus microplus TaxID=6941 RepID=A0A9J6EH33_RHIMP|nr:hypothetical protein HPB51_016250 [Rhipicephalus microplus]